MQSVPKKIFFTKGVGKHKEKLQSLELALRKAGIEICMTKSLNIEFA